MSAIFGLWALDGRPIPGTSFAALKAAMTSWGPAGCTHWQQDNAALGQAQLSVTPASRFEVMPLHDREHGQVLVAAARLDNRAELFDTFGIPLAARPTMPDGRLIRLAYRRWGESCPGKLYGDWSMAVWDYGRQRLFLARDQWGATGLFYCYRPPWFVFASSLAALLAVPEVPRELSEWHLACFLTVFYRAFGNGTMWQGVEQLLPGCRATVTPKGFRSEAYWRLQDAPPVRCRSEDDYLEGFLECYRRAVHCRLETRQPVGLCLSAGLDSGSVAALAAEALRSRRERLTAFTAVPRFSAQALTPRGRFADEWPLAHRLAEYCGNINHVAIRAETVSPLQGLERALAIVPQPVHGLGNMFWIIALLEEAQQRRLGVMLTGQNGNASVSWSGGTNRIFFQFVRGDWQGGRRSLLAWKQRTGGSWLPLLKRQILRPLLGPLWHRRHLLLRPQAPGWADYAAIHPDFARRLRLRQAMRAWRHDPFLAATWPPEEERFLMLRLNSIFSGPWDHALGSAFGLALLDPTADVRLLEYCLGLPEEQYACCGGDRMLLRRGMQGLMPPEVLWHPDKGLQGADLTFRLREQRREVDERLQRLRRLDRAAAYLDLDALDRAWKFILSRQTPYGEFLAGGLFLRGLGAGRFLELLQGAP